MRRITEMLLTACMRQLTDLEKRRDVRHGAFLLIALEFLIFDMLLIA